MAKKVFFSFHYDNDNWRASQVRNIGVVEGNNAVDDNDWETIKRGGDDAIKRWIDGQIDGRSCGVVLIGTGTADRKWINYEIIKCWNEGKGVLGIYIHNLKNRQGLQSYRGSNPFTNITLKNGTVSMATVVPAYDPPYTQSSDVYAHIAQNLSAWVENAIRIRSNYR